MLVDNVTLCYDNSEKRYMEFNLNGVMNLFDSTNKGDIEKYFPYRVRKLSIEHGFLKVLFLTKDDYNLANQLWFPLNHCESVDYTEIENKNFKKIRVETILCYSNIFNINDIIFYGYDFLLQEGFEANVKDSYKYELDSIPPITKNGAVKDMLMRDNILKVYFKEDETKYKFDLHKYGFLQILPWGDSDVEEEFIIPMVEPDRTPVE